MIIFGYLLVCLIFGTTFLAIKIGVDAGAPPFFSAGIRFFIAGLILFIWMVWRKKAKISLLLRKENLITGIGLTFGTFSALYWAEQYVASGIAAVLSATGPIMILLMQTIILRHKAETKKIYGCVIGFAGVILLLLPSLSIKANLFWVIGSVIILIGELFYASGSLYSKQVITRFPDTSPIALNAVQMMYGGLLLLVLSLFTEQVNLESMLTFRAVGSLLYLIVIGSMVGHSIYYWLIAKTNPVFPSTWLYISPLIALSIGVSLYNEQVSWLTLLGVITIISGTVLINLDALKQWIRKPEITTSVLKKQS
jgi:drug/metabolite transporter (DMT)-like permease